MFNINDASNIYFTRHLSFMYIYFTLLDLYFYSIIKN